MRATMTSPSRNERQVYVPYNEKLETFQERVNVFVGPDSVTVSKSDLANGLRFGPRRQHREEAGQRETRVTRG